MKKDKRYVSGLNGLRTQAHTGVERPPTALAAIAWRARGHEIVPTRTPAQRAGNDVVDRESDRRHPEKKYRPIAAGELRPTVAIVAAGLLAALAVVGGFVALNQLFGVVVAAYLALQIAYSFFLKHLVIIDVLTIAGGFALRVLGGGAAIGQPISPFLYLSIIFLALFQGFAKRRHELSTLQEDAAGHRKNLEEYTFGFLDQLIVITAAATIVTYSLYPISTPYVPEGLSANVLLLTIPFVLYAMFRYLYLVHVGGMGGTPEEMLLKDRLLLADVVGWALAIVFILYFLPAAE